LTTSSEACPPGTHLFIHGKCQLCGGLSSTVDRRPDWDEWGLGLAHAVATRADCSRRKVGAVLMTRDHTVVATGYNGAPPRARGCLQGGCPRAHSDVPPGSSYDTGPGSCIAIHAEQNALLRASWDEQAGSTLYITDAPCDGCWRLIRGSRVARVVWPGGEAKV
jgi:dCMP deaminase